MFVQEIENPMFAIKLYMMKAYKRVVWIFLDLMVRALGFSDRLIVMIMMCGTPARFSIKLKGVCYVFFIL